MGWGEECWLRENLRDQKLLRRFSNSHRPFSKASLFLLSDQVSHPSRDLPPLHSCISMASLTDCSRCPGRSHDAVTLPTFLLEEDGGCTADNIPCLCSGNGKIVPCRGDWQSAMGREILASQSWKGC